MCVADSKNVARGTGLCKETWRNWEYIKTEIFQRYEARWVEERRMWPPHVLAPISPWKSHTPPSAFFILSMVSCAWQSAVKRNKEVWIMDTAGLSARFLTCDPSNPGIGMRSICEIWHRCISSPSLDADHPIYFPIFKRKKKMPLIFPISQSDIQLFSVEKQADVIWGAPGWWQIALWWSLTMSE